MAQSGEHDLDRLVDIIAERVRARLGDAGGASFSTGANAAVNRGRLPVLGGAGGAGPGTGGFCENDEAPGEDCASCGGCVVRRPWSVRAIEDAGASRVAAPLGISKLADIRKDTASLIDHTLLKPDATHADIVKLCEEARKHSFASVCVNTAWVPLAKSLLAGSSVMVCSVVGFPLGAMSPTAKAYEAREAVRQGAQEIDMVINIGALKSGDLETVFEDICRVVKASKPAGVKVILECSALDDDEKVIGCALSKLAGAAFVKTSTGFGKGGATVDDVALMRRVVGADMGVKASGGVRTADDVSRMTAAGASRIGASASVEIVTGTGGKRSAGAKGY